MRSETRPIRVDLLTPPRIGDQSAFDTAVEDAADAASELEIRAD